MRKILVIDDDEIVRRYFNCLLERLGYQAQLASDGQEGLAQAASPDIDLIISDLRMPGEPFGLELIRQIRQQRPDCPLVVISGEGDSEISESCATLGVKEFLTKPFEMSFIRDLLHQLAP